MAALMPVEAILDSVVADSGVVLYKVKWAGYPSSEATYEPADVLPPDVVARFEGDDDMGEGGGAGGSESDGGSDSDAGATTGADDVLDGYIASEEEYEVERLVDRRVFANGVTMWRVRWRGYGEEDDTWEPRPHLRGCEDLIDLYECRRYAADCIANAPGAAPAA
mmetsp:Transcript_11199/g.38967  ORF Transcript_11199/g.38967 Transcript_11199/m.38967 type:complete len:165 (-) Transcript_11199:137-631(-)